MTLRHIADYIGVTAESAGRNYAREFGQPHPGFDFVLQPAQVEALLSRMSERTTRRTPEAATAAQELLAEFRAGKHQNGHLEGKEMKPARSRDSEILREFAALSATRRRAKAQEKRTIPAPSPVTQPAQRRKWPTVSMLDVVYYTTIATAVYGLWFTLKEMGLAFSVPYCLVSLHALSMAKNPESRQTARAGVAAVVVLEVLTFFIHLTLFNLRAVQAAKAGTLPFLYWDDPSTPWYIACVLAGMFSAAGVYAVAVTFSLTSEKHNAAEKEKADSDTLRRRCAELETALRNSANGWAMVDGWNEVRRATAERYAHEANEILSVKKS
jgi:hypothetical protein